MNRIALLGGALVLGTTLAACAPSYGGYGGGSGYDPYNSYAAPSYRTPYDTTYAYGSGYQSYRPQPYYAPPVYAPPRHHGEHRRCRDGSRCDRDDNPPGPRGGPGTNWENPPGPAGGPGASPNRRQWSRSDRDDDDRRGERRRRW